MSTHKDLVGLDLHEPYHYVQEADPGAVGSNLYWLKVSTGALKRRNVANSGWDSVGSSISAFTSLSDVPSSYVGNASKVVRVNSGETALEFVSLQVAPSFTVLTDGATVTLTCDPLKTVQNATVTLGGNRALAITGAVNGMTGTLIVKQDATGSRTLSLPAGSKVIGSGGGAISLTSATLAIDILGWVYDGTNYIWSKGLSAT